MENEFNPAKMLVERALSMIDEMPEQAFTLLMLAGAGGQDPRGLYLLGRMLTDGKGVEQDVEKGIGYIEKSAGLDYPDAEYWLACRYYFGTGTDIDYDKAFGYVTSAVEHGHVEAMNLLCDCYVHGHGVPVDPQKGVEWLLKYSEAKGIDGMPIDEPEEEQE